MDAMADSQSELLEKQEQLLATVASTNAANAALFAALQQLYASHSELCVKMGLPQPEPLPSPPPTPPPAPAGKGGRGGGSVVGSIDSSDGGTPPPNGNPSFRPIQKGKKGGQEMEVQDMDPAPGLPVDGTASRQEGLNGLNGHGNGPPNGPPNGSGQWGNPQYQQQHQQHQQQQQQQQQPPHQYPPQGYYGAPPPGYGGPPPQGHEMAYGNPVHHGQAHGQPHGQQGGPQAPPGPGGQAPQGGYGLPPGHNQPHYGYR